MRSCSESLTLCVTADEVLRTCAHVFPLAEHGPCELSAKAPRANDILRKYGFDALSANLNVGLVTQHHQHSIRARLLSSNNKPRGCVCVLSARNRCIYGKPGGANCGQVLLN